MRKILFGLMAGLSAVAVLGLLGAGVYVFAGNLDSPSAPGTEADKMYTTEEIYQYIKNSTTPGARTAVFDEPATGPVQISGTADSATSTTLTDAALNSYADDYFNTWRIEITGGTGAGQTRDVGDFTQTGGVVTVTRGWIGTPDSTSTYELSRMHTLTDIYYALNPDADPAPGEPSAGGDWIWVPGNASLGTTDFWVMKYEAKDVSTVATSQAALTSWVNITQTNAYSTCNALSEGCHLCTKEEAQTINWNIENEGSSWVSGTVGIGVLYSGHSDNSPSGSLAADVTGDPDDDPYVGTGDSSPSIEKRTFTLSNGEVIWDWSGNVSEWLGLECTSGTGADYWCNATNLEWSDGNLSDYEKPTLGPEGAYTSTQNAGRYYGCTVNGNAAYRGGGYNTEALLSGVFFLGLNIAPSTTGANYGFRCCK